jgi:hypothetical protein
VLGRDLKKKATDACLYQGRSLPATKENELDLTGFNRMSFSSLSLSHTAQALAFLRWVSGMMD